MSKPSETPIVVTLGTLTKGNVWDIQENDVFRMFESADRDDDLRENFRRFRDILCCAFLIDEIKEESPLVKAKYEKQGYKVAQVKIDERTTVTWALKKKPITRVTDLSYENIRHISAAKLVEVLERNFGGGWDSLSQSIQDIIEHGFYVSTTTLPTDRLHKKGGMYEKKMEDGYEVLEVPKGTWTEAIFVKVKPAAEKLRMKFNTHDDESENENEDEDVEIEDNYNKPDDDDVEIDDPDDDQITEDNYSTMMDLGGEDDDITADSLEDYADD